MVPGFNLSTKRQRPLSTMTLSITLVPRPKNAFRSPCTQNGILTGSRRDATLASLISVLPPESTAAVTVKGSPGFHAAIARAVAAWEPHSARQEPRDQRVYQDRHDHAPEHDRQPGHVEIDEHGSHAGQSPGHEWRGLEVGKLCEVQLCPPVDDEVIRDQDPSN